MGDGKRILTEQDFEKIRMRRIALENLEFIRFVSWCVLGVATLVLVLIVI